MQVSGDSHGLVRVWQLGKAANTGAPPAVQTVSIASNTGSGGFKKAALVWSLAVQDETTVWAADSKGNTHVIDARMGLAVKRFVAHHGADVLALACHGRYDCFSGGVDGRVVHYRRTPGGGGGGAGAGGEQWVVVASVRLHTHDVRCLCLAGSVLSTGAADSHSAHEEETGRQVMRAQPGPVDAQTPLNFGSLSPCLVSAGLDTQLCVYTYDEARKKLAPGAVLRPLTAAQVAARLECLR